MTHSFMLRLMFGLALVSFGSSGAGANEATIKLTVLGSGYVEPLADKYGASILVEAGEEKLLFDAGRGTATRLRQLGVGYESVDKLFLTHLHSDHVVGIPDLFLTGWVLGRRTSPLRIWGPAGTEHMAHHLVEAYEFDIVIRSEKHTSYPAAGARIEATEFEEGVVYEANGVKVTAFTVDHGLVSPAFGFRVDYRGRSIALSGDTRPSDNLIKHASGVDVLLHEAFAPVAYAAAHPEFPQTVIESVQNVHTTPRQAGEVFAAVNPRLAVFYHIDPGEAFARELRNVARESFDGPLEVSDDLTVITVGDEIRVQRMLP